MTRSADLRSVQPPSDRYNPISGQVLTVRYRPVADDDKVSVNTLQARLDDGGPVNLRMTHRVQEALSGPPIIGTPDREQCERTRAQSVDGGYFPSRVRISRVHDLAARRQSCRPAADLLDQSKDLREFLEGRDRACAGSWRMVSLRG